MSPTAMTAIAGLYAINATREYREEHCITANDKMYCEEASHHGGLGGFSVGWLGLIIILVPLIVGLYVLARNKDIDDSLIAASYWAIAIFIIFMVIICITIIIGDAS